MFVLLTLVFIGYDSWGNVSSMQWAWGSFASVLWSCHYIIVTYNITNELMTLLDGQKGQFPYSVTLAGGTSDCTLWVCPYIIPDSILLTVMSIKFKLINAFTFHRL